MLRSIFTPLKSSNWVLPFPPFTTGDSRIVILNLHNRWCQCRLWYRLRWWGKRRWRLCDRKRPRKYVFQPIAPMVFPVIELLPMCQFLHTCHLNPIQFIKKIVKVFNISLHLPNHQSFFTILSSIKNVLLSQRKKYNQIRII